MTVKQVGSSTAGKYCGGSLFQPAVQQGGQLVPDPEIGNWVLYLMTFKTADANGKSISSSGLYPDIWTSSLTLPELKLPLGDPLDPFIAKAIAAITGHSTPTRDRNEIRRSGVHPAARTNGPTRNTLRLADRFDRYDSRNRRFALTESEPKMREPPSGGGSLILSRRQKRIWGYVSFSSETGGFSDKNHNFVKFCPGAPPERNLNKI